MISQPLFNLSESLLSSFDYVIRSNDDLANIPSDLSMKSVLIDGKVILLLGGSNGSKPGGGYSRFNGLKSLVFSPRGQIVLLCTFSYIFSLQGPSSGFTLGFDIFKYIKNIYSFNYGLGEDAPVYLKFDLEHLSTLTPDYSLYRDIFYGCERIYNVRVGFEGIEFDSMVTSFRNCVDLVNCVSGWGSNFSGEEDYSGCSNLVNCEALNGFIDCTNLINCSGIWSTAYGLDNAQFSRCTNLINCTGNFTDCTTTVPKGITFKVLGEMAYS